MYGTRDAPQVWQELVKTVMIELGFECCKTNPCVYVYDKGRVRLMVHVDDFMVVGHPDALRWLQGELAKKFEIKCTLLGVPGAMEGEVTFLGRTTRLTKDGLDGSRCQACQGTC